LWRLYLCWPSFWGSTILLDYEQKQQEDSDGHWEVQEGKAKGYKVEDDLKRRFSGCSTLSLRKNSGEQV
jgi:hypothetical protein